MKITLEISDPLLDEARTITARDRTTLRELVEQGLRKVKPGIDRSGCAR